ATVVQRWARVSSWANAGGTPTIVRTIPSSAVRTRRLVMLRSAAGLFRPGRLVYFLRLGGFLHLVWLRDVRLGRDLWMMMLEVADGLTEVLVRHQALRLHLLEDLAPTRVFLLRSNLVEREWRVTSARGLRLEQRPGDLLIPWRELPACAGARRLRPRARRDAERDDHGEHKSGSVYGSS